MCSSDLEHQSVSGHQRASEHQESLALWGHLGPWEAGELFSDLKTYTIHLGIDECMETKNTPNARFPFIPWSYN